MKKKQLKTCTTVMAEQPLKENPAELVNSYSTSLWVKGETSHSGVYIIKCK